jgi:hypothetical protein
VNTVEKAAVKTKRVTLVMAEEKILRIDRKEKILHKDMMITTIMVHRMEEMVHLQQMCLNTSCKISKFCNICKTPGIISRG